MRRTETDGPQAITVHPREKAVVISSAEYHRIRGERASLEPPRTGRDLLQFFQNSPLSGVDLDIERSTEPIDFDE